MPVAPILLVAMPWTTLRAPSIQVGLVKAILEESGLRADAAHFYVPFLDFLAERLNTALPSIDALEAFGSIFGEWAFTVPPFRPRSEIRDERFRHQFSGEFGESTIDLAFAIRGHVPEFLQRATDEILDAAPAVVGFSTTFAQTVPSLVLAKMLKQRAPDIKIVMGGSNCEGPMGAALHRLYPWIDVVVRGEAERVAPRLFAELADGGPITPQPGLCIREEGRVHLVAEEAPKVIMQQVPLPDYADYFTRIAGTRLAEEKIWLPYETSRGCWWGISHLCTFCAANGQTVTFRSKPADKVLREIPLLASRYGVQDIWFVDNIIDERYLTTLFPRLTELDSGLSIFVETKAHLPKHKLQTLRDAGVVMAQVGIESMSTPILKLMDKGTSAIQNIRTLKWCAECGIKAFWNLIYGFPGEDPADYERQANFFQALAHFEAPNDPVPLRLDRFSPYHNDPEKYGLVAGGPLPINQFVHHGAPEDVLDAQYFLSFRYADGRDPESYTRWFREACTAWRRDWRQNFCRLSYSVKDDRVEIVDLRTNREPALYRLSEVEGKLYLACDAGVTPGRAWELLDDELRAATSVAEVAAFLEDMTRKHAMFEEGGVYLALAVATDRGFERRMNALPPLDALSDVRASAAAHGDHSV